MAILHTEGSIANYFEKSLTNATANLVMTINEERGTSIVDMLRRKDAAFFIVPL